MDAFPPALVTATGSLKLVVTGSTVVITGDTGGGTTTIIGVLLIVPPPVVTINPIGIGNSCAMKQARDYTVLAGTVALVAP